MGKNLIERDKAFEIYFSLGVSRKLSKLHRHLSKKYPKRTPSYPTLKNWAKTGDWNNLCEGRDGEIVQQVTDVLMPAWVDVKVNLIQAFVGQIETAVKSGIVPENTRDLVAASKEIRALLGEPDKHEVVNITKHEVSDDPEILKSANELAQKLSKHA